MSCNLPVVFNPSGPNNQRRCGAAQYHQRYMQRRRSRCRAWRFHQRAIAHLHRDDHEVRQVLLNQLSFHRPRQPHDQLRRHLQRDFRTPVPRSCLTATTAGANSTFGGWAVWPCNGGNSGPPARLRSTPTPTSPPPLPLNTWRGHGCLPTRWLGVTVNCTSPVNHGATTTCSGHPSHGLHVDQHQRLRWNHQHNEPPARRDRIIAARTVTANFSLTATIPNPPTIGTATAGNGSVTIAFTPPMNKRRRQRRHQLAPPPAVARKAPAGRIHRSRSPGLSNGTPVTCTVIAINAIGPSTLRAVKPVSRPPRPRSPSKV